MPKLSSTPPRYCLHKATGGAEGQAAPRESLQSGRVLPGNPAGVSSGRNQSPGTERPEACLPLSRRRPQAHQGDVVGLGVSGGELTDILEDRPADGDRSARRLGHSFEKAVVALGVVELFAGTTRVGHTVGVDHDDVALVGELCGFDHNVVAVQNVVVNHGIALDLKHETAVGAGKFA